MIVDFEGPLELGHTLECGQAFRWRARDGWYHGTVGSVALKVRRTKDGLEVRSSPPVSGDFVRSYFRLDDDLDAILTEVCRDRHMRLAAEKYRGLRLLRQEPWECLVSYVASSASNIPKISRCIEKMSRLYGRKLALDGWETFSFPGPGRLASAGEAGLRGCELGFRAGYIAGIARVFARPGGRPASPRNGLFDRSPEGLLALREAPFDIARKWLLELKGVGEKVADCLLLFSLDKLESFPVDRWVQRATERLFFRGRRQTPRKVRDWGRKHYGRYAGYAQQYLFHYMRHIDE